jgi:hypothetical protein
MTYRPFLPTAARAQSPFACAVERSVPANVESLQHRELAFHLDGTPRRAA